MLFYIISILLLFKYVIQKVKENKKLGSCDVHLIDLPKFIQRLICRLPYQTSPGPTRTKIIYIQQAAFQNWLVLLVVTNIKATPLT